MRLFLLMLLVSVQWLCACQDVSSDNDAQNTARFERELDPYLKDLEEAISVSSQPLDAKYSRINTVLWIALEKGYLYKRFGIGSTYEISYGRVQIDKNSLVLEEEGSNGISSPARPSKLMILQWGERVYLLDPLEIDDFKEAVAKHSEPRDSGAGVFLMRVGDKDAHVMGVPQF